jgi:predicted RNA binding protein YcfA (HicA-like mRNA interferase family)
MDFRDAERIIKDDGWYYYETRGAHYHYKHPSKQGKVTIPYHKGDLNIKTVKSIFRQAGITR